MKKKTIILVGLVSIVSLIFIVVTVLQHSKTNPTASPSPQNQYSLGTPGPQGSSPILPDDAKYGQALTSLSKQYPWYPKLPIETKKYRIVYDLDKSMFRIRILSITATTDDVKSFTQNALSDLKNIGVPEPIKYYILDANGNQL